MTEFTADSLPPAIAKLLRANQHDVQGPLQVNGAEIDLIARKLADPFSSPLYIEATVEHVGKTKYGKDLSKLAMVRNAHPTAQLLIVSSAGFSLPVQERAAATGIRTVTHDELFRLFERFDGYLTRFAGSGAEATELQRFNEIYEEPLFEDTLGTSFATEYLTEWRSSHERSDRWLIVTGEYGTGKTALTKVLQYRWLVDYKQDPSLPIPFRIELRDFTRQFDADGLLHHFLDHHGLSYIPLEFVHSLIQSGRVVLQLAPSDEMAQYLLPRESRACLEALVQLAAGGAKGLLTSRPNYFTGAEELQVFEVLYSLLS